MSEARGPNPPDQSRDSSWKTYVYDLVSSFSAVVLVGALLFAVSGVWPPLVAIESESMTPNVQVGDLVFVMDEERFPGEAAHADTGVVTAHAASDGDYTRFGNPGDVIVFAPHGDTGTTPIIHRAMFWVEEDDRWYDRADPDYVAGASNCTQLANCPADEAGFITKGDHNGNYDQARNITAPVRPNWVVGTAEQRVPWLGCIRLRATGAGQPHPDCTVASG